MNILFIAFKGIHNTSFQLVDQIGADSVLLTNSFQGLEKDICSISTGYNVVYMFGVDKYLCDKVKIETSANNNDETVNTEFDILCLENKLRSGGISYTVSNKPTRYLCNAAYYHMLKKNPNTVLIHIPSLKGMSIETMNRLVIVFRSIYFVSLP